MSRKIKMAPKDLTIEDLPHTRKELFFDILKQRWKLLLVLGIFLAISIIPTLVVLFLKDYSLRGVYFSYDWSVITEEQILEYESICRLQNNFWNLFLLPCFIVIFIYLAGFMRVIRQLNYSSGIHFGDDFKRGVKQNWLPFLLMGLLAFVIFYICSMMSHMGVEDIFMRYLPLGISIIIFMPLLLNMISLTITYSLKVGSLIKNGFILAFKNILWYLLFIVAFIAPMALFFINYYLVALIIFLFVSMIYYPIYFLANYLFNYASFDKYINQDNYPDIYRKGLY